MNWKLHTSTFELRYPQKFLMWDCAGDLSEMLRDAIPALVLSESNPSKVQLNNPKTGLSVNFQTTSLSISSGVYPNVKNGFASECDLLANLITKELKVKIIDRIGNRTKFHKQFPDAETASKAIQLFSNSNGFTIEHFSTPNDSLKNKTPREFMIKFEDEVGGLIVNLRSTHVKLQIDLQYRTMFPEFSEKTIYFVEVDFDIFTNGPIEIEACSPQDIIQSNVKMLETLVIPKFTIS